MRRSITSGASTLAEVSLALQKGQSWLQLIVGRSTQLVTRRAVSRWCGEPGARGPARPGARAAGARRARGRPRPGSVVGRRRAEAPVVERAAVAGLGQRKAPGRRAIRPGGTRTRAASSGSWPSTHGDAIAAVKAPAATRARRSATLSPPAAGASASAGARGRGHRAARDVENAPGQRARRCGASGRDRPETSKVLQSGLEERGFRPPPTRPAAAAARMPQRVDQRRPARRDEDRGPATPGRTPPAPPPARAGHPQPRGGILDPRARRSCRRITPRASRLARRRAWGEGRVDKPPPRTSRPVSPVAQRGTPAACRNGEGESRQIAGRTPGRTASEVGSVTDPRAMRIRRRRPSSNRWSSSGTYRRSRHSCRGRSGCWRRSSPCPCRRGHAVWPGGQVPHAPLMQSCPGARRCRRRRSWRCRSGGRRRRCRSGSGPSRRRRARRSGPRRTPGRSARPSRRPPQFRRVALRVGARPSTRRSPACSLTWCRRRRLHDWPEAQGARSRRSGLVSRCVSVQTPPQERSPSCIVPPVVHVPPEHDWPEARARAAGRRCWCRGPCRCARAHREARRAARRGGAHAGPSNIWPEGHARRRRRSGWCRALVSVHTPPQTRAAARRTDAGDAQRSPEGQGCCSRRS